LVNDTKVPERGEVVIPAELLAKLGIAIDDQVTWAVEDDRLVLTSRSAAIRRAQELMARYATQPGVSLVDEPIRERREEAAHG
jgi:bifunctional DNA-binding transcriptional regulator/antitoxin component of YhaV-PrlF toxin-antitoxin module